VSGEIDAQLQEASDLAGDIDDTTDAIRVLIEEDDFNNSPQALDAGPGA